MALLQCVAVDSAGGAGSLAVNAGNGWVGTTAGSTIVVGVFYRNTGGVTISSVTDSAADSFTVAFAAVANGNYSGVIYYLSNVGAGVTSVTASFSAGNPAIMFVAEESGVALSGAADGANGLQNATVTAWASGALNTTNAADVLYGFAGSSSSATVFTGPNGAWANITGTGVTAGHHANGTDGDDAYMERQVVSVTGNYPAGGTCNSNGGTVGCVLALKQASVGGRNGAQELLGVGS